MHFEGQLWRRYGIRLTDQLYFHIQLSIQDREYHSDLVQGTYLCPLSTNRTLWLITIGQAKVPVVYSKSAHEPLTALPPDAKELHYVEDVEL